MADKIARYRANLQGEIDGSALYRAIAELDAQPERAEIFRRLAAAEESHAAFWRKQLSDAGASAPALRPSWRTKLLTWIARRFGPEIVIPTLRAAVLGVNDGLVSNMSLVVGVAGAEFSRQTVLLTGLAGLIAGACSMAMGEWLSVQSSRELYQKQIATEKDELAQVPDEEQQELVLIYQSKGMDRATAEQTAARVMANKDAALDTLVREEIGVNPDNLGGSAWSAAFASFAVFILGAIFPVASFFFAGGVAGVAASMALSGAALFASGAVTSVFTGRSALFSGLRQSAIGLAAACVTYGLGRLLGVSLG